VSGSLLERVVLADGTRLVLKHISAANDWIMRATGDTGREARLFEAGVLGRLPTAVDHAVVAVERRGDGWVIAMRDVSDTLIRPGARLGRAAHRRIVHAATVLHRWFRRRPVDDPGLLDLTARYALFTPATGAREAGSGLRPIRNLRRGWELLPELLPGDVAAVALVLAERPDLLAAQLRGCGQTLVHGDLRYANIGLSAERVVLLDWALAGVAPAAVDLAWYLVNNGPWCEVSRDEMLEDFVRLSGEPAAMDLALVGCFLQGAPALARAAVGELPLIGEAAGRAQLGWFVDRVRRALDTTWSPV
jgi:hypothetical protein